MRYLIFMVLLLFCLQYSSFGKNKDSSRVYTFFKEKTLRADIFNAGIGMPPHFVDGRLHPGLQLGWQSALKDSHKHSYFDYTLHLGYFAQQSLQRALYLKGGLGYIFHIYKGIYLRPMLNLSLMGVQQINDEFKMNSNGEYEQVSKLRFQMMPAPGVETFIPLFTSWPLYPTRSKEFALTLGYEFGVQLPFSKISSILPINQLHIGVAIKNIQHKMNGTPRF